MLHGAAQPLGWSELWKVAGAAFGEQTGLKEVFGIYWDCRRGYCSAKVKRVSEMLAELAFFFFIERAKMVGRMLALSQLLPSPPPASLVGTRSCMTEARRRGSQRTATWFHLLCWH